MGDMPYLYENVEIFFLFIYAFKIYVLKHEIMTFS